MRKSKHQSRLCKHFFFDVWPPNGPIVHRIKFCEHFKQFKAWLVEFCQIQSVLKREKTNKWFRCQIYLSKIKEKQICSESRKWMSLGKAWTSSKYINCWLHHQFFHDILYYVLVLNNFNSGHEKIFREK